MRRKNSKTNDIKYDLFYLTTFSAIFYFLFQYLFIHTCTTMNHEDFKIYWLHGSSEYFTPYAHIVQTVSLLIFWAFAKFIKRIVTWEKIIFTEILFYSIYFFVMGYWLISLQKMMVLFNEGHSSTSFLNFLT